MNRVIKQKNNAAFIKSNWNSQFRNTDVEDVSFKDFAPSQTVSCGQ